MSAHALRVCHIQVELSDSEGEIGSWRLSYQNGDPAWHQLTTLSVFCTNSSLPLIAYMMTSGTITNLQLGGSADHDDPPSSSAFQDLWSAIEAYAAPITLFVFDFTRPSTGDIPPLDHLLPFLTSCTDLCILSAHLDRTDGLLSMPKLKTLKVLETLVEDTFDTVGLTLFDMLGYILQEPRSLEILELTYEVDFDKDASIVDQDNLKSLMEVANVLKIQVLSGEEGVSIDSANLE